MKKLLIGLLTILGIALAAILIVPSLIDWNPYRPEIAARIGAATGRSVALEGDIALAMLPMPTLSVAGVRLANPAGAVEPDMLRLIQLDVRIALMPLLSGRIEVQSIELVEPTITIETLPDGRLNWNLAAAQADGDSALADAVSLGRVTIRDGTVAVLDPATGQAERITAVNARLTAGSLLGPFHVQGSFSARGVPLRAEIAGGRMGGSAVPVRAGVVLADSGATLKFSGIIAGGSDGPGGSRGPAVQGELRVEGSDLYAPIEVLRQVLGGGGAADVAPVPAWPFSARAALAASAKTVELTNLEMTLGETRGSGSVKVAHGGGAGTEGVEIALSFNRVDLDDWLASGGDDLLAAAFGRGMAGAAFHLPAAMTGRADLAIDGLGYRGGLARQIRLETRLDHGTVTVDRLTARLPGGGQVAVAGTLTATEGAPDLEASVEVGADNLRGVLDWLGIDARSVPPERLHKVALTGHVRARPGNIQVSGVELGLDTTRLTGGLSYVASSRPALGLRLEVDRFNLDAYLPPAVHLAEVLASLVGPNPGAFLAGFDANLKIDAGSLTLDGVPMQGLALDATLADGALTLRRVQVADLAGLTGSLSGTVRRLDPPGAADLSFRAEWASLPVFHRTFGTLPMLATLPTDQLGKVALTGRVRGNPERAAVNLKLDAVGGTVDAGGTLLDWGRDWGRDWGADSSGEFKVRATWADTARLAGLLPPDSKLVRLMPGGFDLYAEVAGSRRALALTGIQGAVGGVSLEGAATIDLERERPVVKADLKAGTLTLDPPVPPPVPGAESPSLMPLPLRLALAGFGRTPAEPIDLTWLRSIDGGFTLAAASLTVADRRIDQPVLEASLADGSLALTRFEGALSGGRIGARGRLAVSAEPGAVPETALALTLAQVPVGRGLTGAAIDAEGGTVDLDLEIKAAGRSGAALVAALNGQGRITLRDTLITGFDLSGLGEGIARLEQPGAVAERVGDALNGGRSRAARLDATFTVEPGTLRLTEMRLSGPAGEVEAAGVVSLAGPTLDIQASVRPSAEPPVPAIGVTLSGPLDQPRRRLDTAAVEAFIAQRNAEAAQNRKAAEPPPPPPEPPQPEAPAPVPAPVPAPAVEAPKPARPRPATEKPKAVEKPKKPVPAPDGGNVIRNILEDLKRGSP